jgi:hypothetical protein
VIGAVQGGPTWVAYGYHDISHLGAGISGGVVVAIARGDFEVLTHELTPTRHATLDRRMGRAAALPSGRLVAVPEDGAVVDVASRSTLATCRTGGLRSWFSPASDQVLVSCLDGQTIAVPVIDGLARVVHAQAATDVDGTEDGHLLATCSSAGTLTLVNAITRKVHAISGSIPLGNVELLHGRGLLVAAGENQGVIAVWTISKLPGTYPMDDAQIHAWLHSRGD